MYIVRTYECTSRILKKLALRFQYYSELFGLGILICGCVTCRKILDLKSRIPEDSNPNGGGNPDKVTLRLNSSCGEGCTYRMFQPEYHKAAE